VQLKQPKSVCLLCSQIVRDRPFEGGHLWESIPKGLSQPTSGSDSDMFLLLKIAPPLTGLKFGFKYRDVVDRYY
jgi:hypothetical protein